MIDYRLRRLLVACFFLTSVSAAQPDPSWFVSDSILTIVPFTNRSDFGGSWNIAQDVPRFMSVYLKERFRVGIVSPVSVRDYAAAFGHDTVSFNTIDQLSDIAGRFRTRYIVSADISEFSISRFMVSEVQLAGYESFSAEVRIAFTLYDASQFGRSREAIVYEGEAEGVVTDRGLGITLFGKQTNRANEYFALDEIAFGSGTFNKTIIGEALLKCADDLGTKLERAIPSLISKRIVLSESVVIDSTVQEPGITLRRQLINGDIVLVDEDEVFINLGSQDGLAVGDILPVFSGTSVVTDPGTGAVLGSKDEKIGEVQVIELRAEHLCLASIISGKGLIKAKQKVRKVFVR